MYKKCTIPAEKKSKNIIIANILYAIMFTIKKERPYIPNHQRMIPYCFTSFVGISKGKASLNLVNQTNIPNFHFSAEEFE